MRYTLVAMFLVAGCGATEMDTKYVDNGPTSSSTTSAAGSSTGSCTECNGSTSGSSSGGSTGSQGDTPDGGTTGDSATTSSGSGTSSSGSGSTSGTTSGGTTGGQETDGGNVDGGVDGGLSVWQTCINEWNNTICPTANTNCTDDAESTDTSCQANCYNEASNIQTKCLSGCAATLQTDLQGCEDDDSFCTAPSMALGQCDMFQGDGGGTFDCGQCENEWNNTCDGETSCGAYYIALQQGCIGDGGDTSACEGQYGQDAADCQYATSECQNQAGSMCYLAGKCPKGG